MATVGNLFVNIRGRTNGFVRDLGKAHKRVQKDFYRNEAMARQGVQQAIQRKLMLVGKGASPEAIERSKAQLATARTRLDIARRRPARLEQRRELMAAKGRGEATRAFLASEAKALMPLVFGVPAALLAFSIRKGTQAFSEASKFAVMGPQGGRVIEAKIGKLMDDISFAMRPDVSNVMAKAAELDRETAILWREVGLQFQIVMNLIMEKLGIDISSPKIKGDPGFVPGKLELSDKQRKAIDQAHRLREAQRTGETILPPAVGSPYFGF